MRGTRLFALLVILLTLSFIYFSWKSPFCRALQKQEPIFFLLVGIDWVDYARHADTILLARYDPKTRSLDLLSIPRDTKIDLPPLKVNRINEIYAWHYRTKKNHEQASHELAKAVETLLFVQSQSTLSAIPSAFPQIPFYVQLDYEGFKRMVDLLGGVEMIIDEPMHYDDHWGKLHIHFDPGKVRLNGKKALEYVRFRDSSGDYGRTIRQQEFLLKLFERFKHPENILKLPKIFGNSLKSFQSNLTIFEKFLLLLEVKDLTRNQIQLMQLPGRMYSGFWIPDMEGVAATARLLGRDSKKQPQELASALQESTLRDASPPMSAATVEVWNASSKKGLALEVVRKLRRAGFDVVKWGNYESRQLRTYVRDQTGNVERSRALVSVLASPRIEVFTRIEKNPLVDIVVILGEDYAREQ